MKVLDRSKSCPKPEKILSEKQKVVAEEFLDARYLHDRFCKFEIPYKAPETIQIIRLIKQIIPIEELKEADLSFKLNSLRWFLTSDGRKFLTKSRLAYQLGLKRKELDLNKPTELVQKTVDRDEKSPYDNNTKIGEDRVFEKKKQTIADFII